MLEGFTEVKKRRKERKASVPPRNSMALLQYHLKKKKL
jgi:hypothetical protein